MIAGLVGMPLSKVRVIAPDPGGGFGGKQHTKYEPPWCSWRSRWAARSG